MPTDAAIDPSQVTWDAAPPADAAAPDPSQVKWDDEAPTMPTTAQMTDKNASPADIGATARQTGAALAAGNGPDETGPGIAEAADTGAALTSGALVGGVGGGVAGLLARIKASFTSDKTPDQAAADAHKWVDQYVYQPQTAGGQKAVGAINDALKWEAEPFVSAEHKAETALGPTAGGLLHTAVGTGSDILNASPALAAGSSAFDLAKAGAAREADTLHAPGDTADVRAPPMTLADQVAASPQNAGAAAAVPDVSKLSAPLQQAVSDAAANGPVNLEALQRHANADTLPMPDGATPEPLRLGQATRNDQQISDEKNMRADPDTQGILTDSINNQDKTFGLSMGEIRQRSTPTIVQRSTIDNGQTGVDAIKAEDNARISDIRQKYKTLADQNGGSMPLDAAVVLPQVKQQLATGFLTKTAADNPVISEIMDSLEPTDSGPAPQMSFEAYSNALSNLSAVQRARGPDAAAATVLRNALEEMPLPEGAQHLKALRDTAASAAKARFDTIEQNPAYEAVVNDNTPKTPNGLHVVGAPSPLADKFMDNYFLGNGSNASRAYVQRMQTVMKNNPDFAPAVEASALIKLRDAAKLDQYDSSGAGGVAHASFQNAYKALTPKADVLMSPETRTNLEQLRQYSEDVNYEGKGSSTNRSGTMLALQRHGAQFPAGEPLPSKGRVAAETLADWGTDALGAHGGPLGFATVKGAKVAWKWRKNAAKAAEQQAALQSVKDAKLRFAQEATAPGAGLNGAPTGAAQLQTARASGGRVDHEALAERLFQRWKRAQKDADETTKPLLNVPDASITKALRIAQAHPLT